MDRLNKLALWHQVSSAKYLGPIRFRALWQLLGDEIGRVFSMQPDELRKIPGVGAPQCVEGIRAQASKYDESLEFMKKQIQLADTCAGTIVTLDEPRYPRALAASKLCHPIIYCVGKLAEIGQFDRSVAIVGTRLAAPESLEFARRTGSQMGQRGWVVVSGMANGIDSAAHEGALAADGRTIAVLGCGPDVLYPPEARDLRDRIRLRGLLLSEYPFGQNVDQLNLKKRNKTTVALSSGLVLVESDADGGAVNALNACAEQKKPVFTIIPPWHAKIGGNEQAKKYGAIVLPPNDSAFDILGERLVAQNSGFYKPPERPRAASPTTKEKKNPQDSRK